jgi:exopolysaccharide biosynthesis polyprenyl glycosylphosphotransferase
MINLLIRFRAAITLLLDLVIGVISLLLTLLIRYGVNGYSIQFQNHTAPFLLVILVFLLSFYTFNLYSARFNRIITEFNDSFIKSILMSLSLSILLFYIYGTFFNLTPKTNLVLFTIIFSVIDFSVRILVRRQYSRRNINRKIVLISSIDNALINEIKSNQTIGYQVVKEMKDFNYEEIVAINPDIVIVDSVEGEAFNKLYVLLKKEISVYTVNLFYEEIFQKIPTETIDKNKIIEYINKNKSLFTSLKRGMDVVISFLLLIFLSPLFILISILIKLTSRGPVLIKQKRVGKNDSIFILYKFRSMFATDPDGQSEGGKAQWTTDDKSDKRITAFGRILRKTHLDEMPQLINILEGDLSLVGPRPERPEFTKILNEGIPYYDLRHSVKPGLTGWAQVNYRYGSSMEDTKEKLKFDFYYIKNRSIFLDILILLKTVAMILTKH